MRRLAPSLVVLGCLLATGCGGEEATDEPIGDNTPPVATLDAPLRARAGEPVLLSAGSSTDDDGFIAEFWFETGDGTPLRQTVSAELYQTFAEPGVYTVTLHVIDDDGAKDTDRAEIDVR